MTIFIRVVDREESSADHLHQTCLARLVLMLDKAQVNPSN